MTRWLKLSEPWTLCCWPPDHPEKRGVKGQHLGVTKGHHSDQDHKCFKGSVEETLEMRVEMEWLQALCFRTLLHWAKLSSVCLSVSLTKLNALSSTQQHTNVMTDYHPESSPENYSTQSWQNGKYCNGSLKEDLGVKKKKKGWYLHHHMTCYILQEQNGIWRQYCCLSKIMILRKQKQNKHTHISTQTHKKQTNNGHKNKMEFQSHTFLILYTPAHA